MCLIPGDACHIIFFFGDLKINEYLLYIIFEVKKKIIYMYIYDE